MNWTNFKQYLEKTILIKKEELEEEEESEEESQDQEEYTLRPEFTSKHSVSNKKELISVLTNLITSIDNNEETNYHALPELTDLLSEDNKLKQWKDYFPNRQQTHFGKKEEIEVEISREVWTHLAKIFNNWTQEATRKERLEEIVSEDNIMGKILFEGLTRLNAEALKKQGYDKILRNWLKEYEQLDKTDQENLEKQKKQVEVILATLTENSEKEEQKTWYQNIPWTKVIWYGGGGLLIILVIGWLRSKFKEK